MILKHILYFLTQIKLRYYISAGIVISAIAATPAAVRSAYRERGYKGFGGEYLLVPLGLAAAAVLCAWLHSRDEEKERHI